MLSIRTILHPSDLTDYSEGALHLACRFAQDYDAELVIIHVANELLNVDEELGLPPVDARKEELRAQLASLQIPSGLHVKRLLEQGDASEEILRAAALFHADLLVMGTHGRRGLSRLMMGSVAERVVREAPCPVLTVKKSFAAEAIPAMPGAENVCVSAVGE